MQVYEIPEQNFAKLTERFDAMVNRSRKCKTVAPTFHVIHEYEETTENKETGITSTQLFYYVVLEGERPQVNGWEFVATIDHTNETGNIIRGVPGMGDVPVAFRKSSPHCEHCGHIRQRHETFVLRNGTEYKQVGRNCLADFFAGDLADYVVPLTELWESLGEMMESMGGEEYGPHQECRYPSHFILNLVQRVIALRGWLSNAKRQELLETRDHVDPSTSSLIHSLLGPAAYQSDAIKELWAEIKELIAERGEDDTTVETTTEHALEWARAIDPEGEATNDYLYNLHTISKGESVNGKGIGLLCSLIPAYKRVTEQRKEREAKPVSSHIGAVGDRMVFENVTVEWVGQPTYSQWGATTPIKFVDGNGNVLMNWCSGSDSGYTVGEKLSLVGTVKSHDVYRDVAQTVINRIKEWDGKPVKQAKKKK